MPTISSFPAGDTISFSVTFSVSSVDTDPTAVTFKIKNPNKSVTTYIYLTDAELTKTTTGQYKTTLVLNLAGEYSYRWEGTGAAPGVAEDTIKISRSDVI